MEPPRVVKSGRNRKLYSRFTHPNYTGSLTHGFSLLTESSCWHYELLYASRSVQLGVCRVINVRFQLTEGPERQSNWDGVPQTDLRILIKVKLPYYNLMTHEKGGLNINYHQSKSKWISQMFKPKASQPISCSSREIVNQSAVQIESQSTSQLFKLKSS